MGASGGVAVCRSGRLLALLVAGLSGCNLLTGAADLSIETAGESTPGTEAGTGSPDASEEAGRVDAGSDGQSGGQDATTVTAPACTATMKFCDDFDPPGRPLEKWGVVNVGGGTAAVDSVASVSAPSSLLVTWPVGGAPGSTKGAELQVDLGAATASVRVVAGVRVEAIGNADKQTLSLLTLSFGTTYTISFGVGRSGSPQIEERKSTGSGSSTTFVGLSTALVATAAFQTVDMTVTFGASPNVSVVIDGKPAGTKVLTPTAPLGAMRLVVGDSSFNGSSLDWRVRYDNVSVLAP